MPPKRKNSTKTDSEVANSTKTDSEKAVDEQFSTAQYNILIINARWFSGVIKPMPIVPKRLWTTTQRSSIYVLIIPMY